MPIQWGGNHGSISNGKDIMAAWKVLETMKLLGLEASQTAGGRPSVPTPFNNWNTMVNTITIDVPHVMNGCDKFVH